MEPRTSRARDTFIGRVHTRPWCYSTLAASALALLGSSADVYGDNLVARADLFVNPACQEVGCTQQVGTVTFRAATVGCIGGCTISYEKVFTLENCDYTAPTVDSVKLHVGTDGCAGCGEGAEVVDLSSGNSFAASQADWDNLLGEVYVVVAVIDTDSNGLIDRAINCARKFIEPPVSDVPTLSTWGAIAMTALLLVAGTVVIRKRQVAGA